MQRGKTRGDRTRGMVELAGIYSSFYLFVVRDRAVHTVPQAPWARASPG